MKTICPQNMTENLLRFLPEPDLIVDPLLPDRIPVEGRGSQPAADPAQRGRPRERQPDYRPVIMPAAALFPLHNLIRHRVTIKPVEESLSFDRI